MTSRFRYPLVLAVAALVACVSDACAQAPAAIVKPVLTRALPDLPGHEVSMVTVEYPPGGASKSHSHGTDTFVYVLEGTLVMQVAGGQEMTLGPGETFYESPTDVHSVSRNASATLPAKFLVFFVKKQDPASGAKP
jgi:quercetin dioxygenase-like cupin family protein